MHGPTDLPRWVYIPAAAGTVFVVLPLFAIAIKVDWPNFWSLIASPSSRTALLLSLKTAAASTALCVLFGVPMALVLARSGGRLVRLLRPLIVVAVVPVKNGGAGWADPEKSLSLPNACSQKMNLPRKVDQSPYRLWTRPAIRPKHL